MVILHRATRSHPVVIAANRDESYGRPTRPPQRLEGIDAVAGLDVERGGTWMGATRGGFVAAITNQRTWSPPDRSRSSRGEVVLECLRRGELGSVRELLAGIEPREYNPFNLIYGSAAGLECAYLREGGVSFEPVPAGLSVLPNDVLESPAFAPKVSRARELVGDVAQLPWPQLCERLVRTLADHRRPSPDAALTPPPGSPISAEMARELGALCIHTPAYGTRSVTVVALEPGRVARYLHADGPACVTDLADLSDLF